MTAFHLETEPKQLLKSKKCCAYEASPEMLKSNESEFENTRPHYFLKDETLLFLEKKREKTKN